MKHCFIFLVFLVLTKSSFGQANSIVGAWYWKDSTKAMSFFFEEDGDFSMHSGPKGEAILLKNTKKGTYSYVGNKLTIKWEDFKVETNALMFLDANTFRISLADKKGKKQVFVFRRIVDEVIFEK
jgi:hypothetical protein